MTESQKLADDAGKSLIAHEFANELVRIENDTQTLLSVVFRGFRRLGFSRVRVYKYRHPKCISWRCCDGHAPEVRCRFESGEVILSPDESEPDNFASMVQKTPLIVVYDPECHVSGRRQDERGRHVFATSTDPWYDALGKPGLGAGETFEWLDCPLLVGSRILGKITMDRCQPGTCFNDADLALTAPLSFLVAAAIERNPIYDFDVFVSFHSSHRHLADTVAYVLENKGLRTFVAPRAIQPGDRFEHTIRDGLLGAKHILALFSSECIGNDWVYAECSCAWLLNKDLTVFRTEGVQVTDLPFFMRSRQSPVYSVDELMEYADRLRERDSWVAERGPQLSELPPQG